MLRDSFEFLLNWIDEIDEIYDMLSGGTDGWSFTRVGRNPLNQFNRGIIHIRAALPEQNKKY